MTQKLTFGRQDPREYEALQQSAMKQHGNSNPFVSGVNQVMNEGVGTAVANSAHNKFSNANIMTNELIRGAGGNFSQKDVPGNQPLEDHLNQTGSQDLGVSSTISPQKDPQEMESEALEKRLAMYSEAAGNYKANLNAGRAY